MVWFREHYTTVLIKHHQFRRGFSTGNGSVISSDATNCFLLYPRSTEPNKGLVCDIDIFSENGNKVSRVRHQGDSGFISMSQIKPGYTRELEVLSLYHEQWKRRKMQLFHYDCVSKVEAGIYLFEIHDSHIDILWNISPVEKVAQNGLVIPSSSFCGVDGEDWNNVYPERKIIDDENYWKQQNLYANLSDTD